MVYIKAKKKKKVFISSLNKIQILCMSILLGLQGTSTRSFYLDNNYDTDFKGYYTNFKHQAFHILSSDSLY